VPDREAGLRGRDARRLFHAILSQDAPSAARGPRGRALDLAVITATAIEKAPERRYKTASTWPRTSSASCASSRSRLGRSRARSGRRAGRGATPALAGSLAAVLSLVVVATGLLSYGVGASGRAELETSCAATPRPSAAARPGPRLTASSPGAWRARHEARHADVRLQVGRDAVAYLRPAFERVLREAGLDLSVPDAVARGKARVTALRARDPNAARALLDILRRFGALPGIEAAALKNLSPLLAVFQDPHTAPDLGGTQQVVSRTRSTRSSRCSPRRRSRASMPSSSPIWLA
jgi:hypothetical protein